MRFLLIFLTLISCTMPPRKFENNSMAYQEKLKKCVMGLIGKYGVEAEKASRVCLNIYKAKQ